MKKTICLLNGLILIIASNVYAMDYQPGPYLGGQIGWGRIDEGGGYKQYVNGKTDLGNFTGWRAYGGYSFTSIFSMEGGYSHYPDNNYTLAATNINIETYTIDLVGKITIPLEKIAKSFSPFSIYGKGGAAYSNTKVDGSVVVRSKETIMPTYGAGIIFNFTDNIAVDASWTSVLGRNYVESGDVTGKVPVPTGHMFTLGLSYKITGIF